MFVLPLLAAMFLANNAKGDDCPGGTVKIGEKRTETADAIIVQPICKSVTMTGALPAKSAKEQLLNSTKETTGQLFDNGKSHDDAVVDAKLPNVATPAAATALDPRLARSKDYQAAATTLANAQTLADTLNKKMTDLQDQQKVSPTPERQIAISDLSAQTSQANGSVAVAKNNLDIVKKKVIGPAIVVDDSPIGHAQSTAKPDRQ